MRATRACTLWKRSLRLSIRRPPELGIGASVSRGGAHSLPVHGIVHGRLPVLLKGPTGCGKTRFVEYMAGSSSGRW